MAGLRDEDFEEEQPKVKTTVAAPKAAGLSDEDFEPEEPSFARQLGRTFAGPVGKGATIGGAIGTALGVPTTGAAIGAGIGKLLQPTKPGEPPLQEKVKAGAKKFAEAFPYKPAPLNAFGEPIVPESPEDLSSLETEGDRSSEYRELATPSAGETRWAFSPESIARRGWGAAKEFAAGTLGETKARYYLEEPDIPDPDRNRPIADEEAARAWDELQKDPEKKEIARKKWDAVYQARAQRGAFKYGENIPEIWETTADEEARLKFLKDTSEFIRKEREDQAKRAKEIGLPEPEHAKTPEEEASELEPEQGWEPIKTSVSGPQRVADLKKKITDTEQEIEKTNRRLQEMPGSDPLARSVANKLKDLYEEKGEYQRELDQPETAIKQKAITTSPGMVETVGAKTDRLLSYRQAAIMKQLDEERKLKRVGSDLWAVPRVVLNAGTDLVENVVGLAQLFWVPFGSMPVPETPQVLAARELLKKAQETKDQKKIDEAEDWLNKKSQEAIGGEIGAGLQVMPGQTLALARGATDMSSSNVALVKPVSFYLQVLMPLESAFEKAGMSVAPSLRKTGVIRPIKKSVATLVASAFDHLGRTLDKATFNKLSGLKAWLVQHMTDVFRTGDKARTEILDDLATNPAEGLDGLSQILTRKVKEVQELEPEELQEVELAFRPGKNVEAARAATRAAEKAGIRAATMADIKGKAAETSALVGKLRKDIAELKRKATKVEDQISKATTDAERVAFQKKLADLQNKQRFSERRLNTELRESRLRGKAKIAGEEAMERGVGFAEEMAEPSTKASVPILITKRMERVLKGLNYDQATIDKLTPQKAWDIIREAGKFEEAGIKPEPGVKAKARAADRTIMAAMAEMERKLSAADEARQRGLQQEDVLREREEQVRARLEAKERGIVGEAVGAGVELAEEAKGLEGEEAAAQAARRAAAAPGRLEAGARRAAETAEARALTAGERPEVSLGRVYVPKEKLTIKQVGEPELVDAVQKTTEQANFIKTPESWAKVARAQKELDIYQELAKEPQIKESDFRVKVEQAQDAVDAATDARNKVSKEFANAIGKWNKGEIERQDFDLIERAYRATEDALTKAKEDLEDARLRQDVARKADLPGKVSEMFAVDKASITNLNKMLDKAKSQVALLVERYQAASVENQPAIAEELRDARGMVERLDQAIKTGSTGELRAYTEEHPDLARMFAEVPAQRRFIIEELATKASDYKKQALDAGFNPDALVSAEAARQIGVPEGTSIYKAARKYAEHVQDLGAEPGLVAEFLRDQGMKRGVDEAGRWLNTEVEAQSAAAGMIEPAYGVARRPAAVIERYEATPEGEVIKRPEAMREAVARAARPLVEGEKPEVGAYGDMKRILREMSEYETVREKPKSFKTKNQEYNEFLQEYAKKIADVSAYGTRDVNPRFDLETPEGPLQPGEVNKWAKREADTGRKLITPERIQLRTLEPFFDKTTQLAIVSEKFRAKVIEQVVKRLKETDLDKKAKYKIIAEADRLLSNPKMMSEHGKNHFPVIKYQGIDLLTPEDFVIAAQESNPDLLVEARTAALDKTLQNHNKSTAIYGTLHGLESELNRFRFDEKGNPLVSDVVGRPVAIENREGYASQLAQDVVRKGKPYPLMMPHEGKWIAQDLLEIANDPTYNWTPQEVAKIKDLAQDVRSFSPNDKLTNVLNRVQKEVFQGTDNKPTDFKNVHMHPAVARALNDHFSSLEADTIGNAIEKELTVLSKKAEKSVVPLNPGSGLNNNLSSTLQQTMKRGSFEWLPEAIRENVAHYSFLNGDYAGMSDVDLLKRKSIAKFGPVGHTDHLKAVSESPSFKAISEKMGVQGLEANLKAAGYDWLLKPAEWNRSIRDFMVEAYSKYGDTFFRLGEMGRIWDDLAAKTWNDLQTNENIEIPVSRNRYVRVTNMGNNKYMIQDASAAGRPSIVVDKYSPELSDVFAKAAHVAQNDILLDPKNLGLWGKSIKRGPLSLLSGIFSWYMGATDVPFMKKGLVYNMMFGEPEYQTNSPTIMKKQADQFWGRSFRRAMMLSAAQSALQDQNKLRELRRSLGFDPAMEATIVAKASNPAFTMSRLLDSAMYVAPTVNLSKAIAGLAYWTEFSPIFNEPEFYAQVMTADRDWEKMSEQELELMKQNNPKMAEHAQTLRTMAKENPQAYKDRGLLKQDFLRYAKGEIATPEKIAQTVGLSGGPALNWIMKVKDGGYRWNTARRKMGEMVFGVGPFRTADFAAALAGKAGADSVGKFSTYGEKLSKAGFFEGSDRQPTMEDYATLYAKNAFGIGWETAFYGNGNESPNDPRGFGRLKSYSKNVRDNLDKFYDEQIKAAKVPLGPDATDEQRKRQQEKLVAAQILKNAVNEEYRKTIATLNQQLEALNKSRQDYPAPVLEPKQ